MKRITPSVRKSWLERHWIFSSLVVGLIVVGIFVHFILHAYLIRYVNRKLNALPDYKAHLDDIGVHLWRGAYSIEGLVVEKRAGESVVPFVKAQTIDISLQWKELLHRHIVAKVILKEPEINIVSSKDEAAEQKKVDVRWQDQVRGLVPFRLNYVRIANGTVHWRDPFSDPPMDIYVHALTINAYNLTNSERLSETLASTIIGNGIVMKDGHLHFEALTNPYEELPTFKSKLILKDLGLPQLNTFFKKYTAIEVHNGTFNVYSEMAGDHGELSGYIKPLLDNLDSMQLKGEKKSPMDVIKGTVIEVLITILTNNPKDRVGTRLQITGRYDQPGISLWVAVTSALRNAFIQALPASLDNKISLKDRAKTEFKKLLGR